ncbi:type II toxin-antitoxin system VapC family toxin [Leptolyngbya sp. NIES-2104]|uniref:type II toxin-antitoxin system VapC family toxin n=1 Tax=Leptolyngbya sp. NIES-2104 TaxID=1552121 RepID=UPI00073ED9CA|nr:type II toxin-antitoxin system VapC family toxin [Leptolyngbya sp. NIES-2104]
MNLLLDTHTFLWYLQNDRNLSRTVAEILESTENTLHVSIVSLWEIAIKLGLGKLDLQSSFDDLRNSLDEFQIEILPIQFEDIQQYLNLPLHHRDPFDRMLIAQAVKHSLVLVSRDTILDAYPIQRLWS